MVSHLLLKSKKSCTNEAYLRGEEAKWKPVLDGAPSLGEKVQRCFLGFFGDQCRSSPLPVPANTQHNLGFMLGTQQPFIHRITNTWAKRTFTSSWTRSGPAPFPFWGPEHGAGKPESPVLH